MGNFKHNRLTLLLLAALVVGCTTPLKEETTGSFVSSQRLLAMQHQANNELATALVHWEIILLIDPGHVEAKKQHDSLESALRQTADTAYKKGIQAANRGLRKKAREEFLTALAANPNHPDARQQLSKIQSLAMAKSQLKKSDLERQLARNNGASDSGQFTNGVDSLTQLLKLADYQGVIVKADGHRNRTNSADIDSLLAQAHVGEAQELIKKNRLSEAGGHHAIAKSFPITLANTLDLIEQLGRSLALAYYQSGRRLLTVDINKGIEYLQTSLSYYPEDMRVTNLLNQSITMRNRLSKIRIQN
jgi:tetratricopeptide (TPR) repeat protein